ncbi:unnamed protein product, partial [Prorocentrum cordatum]
ALWICPGSEEWRARCAEQLRAALPADGAALVESAAGAVMLGAAEGAAVELRRLHRAGLPAPAGLPPLLPSLLERCLGLLRGPPDAWRQAARRALDPAQLAGGPAARFESALVLHVAALRCGLASGHAAVVRRAARE